MAYTSLSEFIDKLISAHEIIVITEPVDVRLEITEIVDRFSKSADYNKALLFTNTGTDFPVLINALGSDRRMAFALNLDSLDDLTININRIVDSLLVKPQGFMGKLKKIPKLAQIARWMPKKTVGKGKCQEEVLEVVDLEALPILQCWPLDGGPFITLPSVHTVDPTTGISNVGMYRMQVFDRYTTGMHWHKHKTGATHFESYKKLGLKMPIAVTLGGDPAYTFSATAPLPENIDEYLLAGFLRNKAVKLVKCLTNDLWIPEDVDFVIEGYIDPKEPLVTEGPFGDHTGFYSLADLYPKMHVTVISHRKNAVYPTTIVGIPPMEDAYISTATERLFTPLISLSIAPEVIDMHMPIWGVAHNLVLVSIKKQYEGQAFKVAQAFWGAGQMMFNKALIVFDSDVDLRDYNALIKIIVKNLVSSSQIMLSKGPIDVLDHSTNVAGMGGKVCIDCTAQLDIASNDEFSFNYLYERSYE
ncbi:MAG: menaquinone biosynthesis decarboxylase, partial [Salinivirgaceae bacterium]|nr:menaquinone biosynthesis decarboxylase [Salinivirgaceae bacterium]